MAEVAKQTLEEALWEGRKSSSDKKWKATITISIYSNSPPETKFDGEVLGRDMSTALRALLKGYRYHKHELLKKQSSSVAKEVSNERRR